tara:strand:- start:749 stop:1258 length:510 start_codon:yes stop_codon:yes gene_type:complete
MAIEDKKYNRIHGKDGGNKDGMKSKFDSNMHSIVVDYPDDWPELAAIIYQIGQLEEEIDYLRGLISTNKDKTTFPGIGKSGSTCLAGNTTTISTSQAKAITANTAKTGISTSQASAITANTAKVSFPVLAEEGNSLSFAINQGTLTILNAWTDPETGKSRTYATKLTLK